MTTVTQNRVALVLDRLKELALADHDMADLLAEELDVLLDDMHSNDVFGTEGQNDPRGDCRDGDWNMFNVQGIDVP